MEKNEIFDKLPKHLVGLVIEKPHYDYTPQDNAVWRYLMMQNVNYLSKHAHESYLKGLVKTRISFEQIPDMYGMNPILNEIGWAVVVVDGYLPLSIFMEFLAHNVLATTAKIRRVDQLENTMVPDIIHDAAILSLISVNKEYAAYLKILGEIGSRAFSSAKDYQIHEAMKQLFILKDDPKSPASEIKKAEKVLKQIENGIGEFSEMSLVRNLYYWTVKNGLTGDIKKPKIYGAGLLSFLTESKNCLSERVKKLPYTIEAAKYNFDYNIQSQLFVTPDFKYMTSVAKEFAQSLSRNKGGLEGVEKAINSDSPATVVLSSGVQISGKFTEVISHKDQAAYIKTSGPTALSYDDHQLSGHGKHIHRNGFGTPAGKLKGVTGSLEFFSHNELLLNGFNEGGETELEFESGVKLTGILENVLRKSGKIILITFSNCQVTYKGTTLFQPDWGVYNMAVGESVISAFSGVADPDNYRFRVLQPGWETPKIKSSDKSNKLHQLYRNVRTIRQSNKDFNQLSAIWETLKKNHPDDWLLAHEILELTSGNKKFSQINKEIEIFLQKKSVEILN